MSLFTGPLQNWQDFAGASDIRWNISKTFPHFLHLYS
jgi:hypothetical protein